MSFNLKLLLFLCLITWFLINPSPREGGVRNRENIKKIAYLDDISLGRDII